MKARNFLILFLLLGLVQPGITWSAKKFPDSVSQLVAETKKEITTIDMNTFKDVVDRKAYDMIIDVREPDEYDVGHVTGAMNIPRGVIEFKIWRYIGYPNSTDTSKRIFLYCKSGSRCALATHSLKKLGFSNVVAVDMKFKDWEGAGYPLDFRVE
jgi:rhodanese-related sulfurtransferase